MTRRRFVASGTPAAGAAERVQRPRHPERTAIYLTLESHFTGGIARPVLRAFDDAGRAGALALVRRAVEEIRLACLLTGSRTLADLAGKPIVVGPSLRRWIPPGSPLAGRA